MSVSARVWSLVFVLSTLHLVLHVGMGIGREAPDLLTIGLLLAAREVRVGWAAGIGFSFGLIEDALTVLAFGANTVVMTALGIAGAFTRDLFVGDSRRFALSYFFVGKLCRDLLHWAFVGETLRQPFTQQVLIDGTVGGLYAAAVGMGLMALTGLTGRS